MPEIHETELKQMLKNSEFPCVCLLYGSEGYLKQYYADTIPKKCVTPGMEGFNYKKFDFGDGATVTQMLDAAQTLPAFGGKMCIVARDCPLDTLAGDDKVQMDAYFADAPDSTLLLFWQDTVEVNAKKSAKWRSVLNTVNKVGVSVPLDKLDRTSLCKLLRSGAKKRGCTLEHTEAAYLAEIVGNDLNLLLGELEKLCNYKGGGEITRTDIDAVATKSLEANIFDLSKALVSGNCAQALEILRKLFAAKEKPEMILGTLIGAYVDMYRVKLAQNGGERAEYPAQFFNYKGKEFRLRNAARDAAKLDIRQLRGCLDALNTADAALKSGAADPRITLERLLVQLSVARAK